MRITSVEPILLRIPFSDGSSGQGLMPTAWTSLDFALIKIETDKGLTGWGEAFGYFCHEAVAALVNRSMAPVLVGQEFTNPPAMTEYIQRKMVLQGRYGISSFALSGVDIALWDLAAKTEQVSLAELLGSRIRQAVPAYASLVRYGDSDNVIHHSQRALELGFDSIKLHEITMDEISTCRQTIGKGFAMMVDVNCNWTESFTRDVIPELIELDIKWLEEPIYPPEDFDLLSKLRKTGIPIAAGENACTAIQFAHLMQQKAVDYLQPSMTKVGGITEFNKISNLNTKYRLPFMPHSPYFGPGYLATLQMAAVESQFELFEYLLVGPQAWIYKDMPLPVNGSIWIPEGPGLGLEPDPVVLSQYRPTRTV